MILKIVNQRKVMKKHKECSYCKHMTKESSGEKSKIKKVMHEFKEKKLHSGSKKGPLVTNPRQAIAISLSEYRKNSKKGRRE